MTVLKARRGRPLVDIADAEGEVYRYLLSPAPSGLDDWACRLERQDTGSAYRVGLGPDGRWRCDCRSWKYRKGPWAREGCKHVRAVVPVYHLLATWRDRHGRETARKECGPESSAPPAGRRAGDRGRAGRAA